MLDVANKDYLGEFLRVFACVFIVALVVTCKDVWASSTSGTGAIEDVMCAVIAQTSGGVGRLIITLVMISIAIMLLLGKASWTTFLVFAVGSGVLIGAKDLVGIISSAGSSVCP
jgi:type IV secretion system protein VirB2